LLQGVPLNISQFYGALHQQAQCGDACEVNKNQTRYRGRDTHYWAPPAQIPACAIHALNVIELI
jgi:hypothetical protein